MSLAFEMGTTLKSTAAVEELLEGIYTQATFVLISMQTLIGFTMSNEIITLIILQIVVVVGMLIKAWVDGYNRVQDRLDRESAAKITQMELADVKVKGAEREKRIIDKIHENTVVTVEAKSEAKAAYKEANNVNVKLESLGIQTKPVLGESAEHPMHTTSP